MEEQRRSGLHLLESATTLLQRVRTAHPTAGVFEAADLQWWWRSPRATDDLPQLVWSDDDGRLAAATVLTAWSDHISMMPIVLPDADAGFVAHVVGRGLAHAAELGLGEVSVVAAEDDEVLRVALAEHGLAADDEQGFDGWLDAVERPAISSLCDGYRLASRAETRPAPHHFFILRGGNDEERLRQTSLYRDDLDLVVLAPDGAPAAYGLMWFDPVTATGMVEPMRTVDEHQRRGLARHVLTAGIDRLAALGATRIKIAWDPDGPAGPLYTDVGFGPPRRCLVVTLG